MGKRIISQKRGRGSPTYTCPSHRFIGELAYSDFADKELIGEVIDIVDCPGHSAPLMIVEHENGFVSLLPALLGIRKGQQVQANSKNAQLGNVMHLKNIPTGTEVCFIEKVPFDKGKLVRTSGAAAIVIGKEGKDVLLKMPSKKTIKLNANCRAMIGKVAGGGRTEKPMLKAGKNYHAMQTKNKLYPRTSGVAMNAVDHPFGKTHRRHLGCPKSVSRNAPPGRKVGQIASRRTGRKKK